MRIAISILALAVATSPAWADCKARLAELSPRVAELSNERDRKLVEFDIKRADKESREGDEDECNEAVDHATTILDAEKK